MRFLRVLLQLVLPFILMAGCTGLRRDDKVLQQVIVRFHELKSQGKLPGLSPTDSGELSAFAVTPRQKEEAWFRPFAKAAGNCLESYLLEVRLEGKQIRYLFCQDSQPPQLVASFQMEHETWIEKH